MSILGSVPARQAITCNTLKAKGVRSSGIYLLHEENQEPRLGYCDMSINDSPMPNPVNVAFFAYSRTGTFTAPQAGLYLLSYSAMDSEAMVQVKKNGRREFHLFRSHESGGGLDYSYTWLSHLEMGDKINVEVTFGQIKTFNGYLVK